MYAIYNLYMVTFTINIPPMLAYIPYMDPMGFGNVWASMSNPSYSCWGMDETVGRGEPTGPHKLINISQNFLFSEARRLNFSWQENEAATY